MTRAIHAIAYEIKREWKKPYFGAIPYLNAMCYLSNITDAYGADSGKSAVLYFLSNAATWQGEKAKAIKIELKYLIEDAEDNYPPKESWKFQARERYGDDP